MERDLESPKMFIYIYTYICICHYHTFLPVYLDNYFIFFSAGFQSAFFVSVWYATNMTHFHRAFSIFSKAKTESPQSLPPSLFEIQVAAICKGGQFHCAGMFLFCLKLKSLPSICL